MGYTSTVLALSPLAFWTCDDSRPSGLLTEPDATGNGNTATISSYVGGGNPPFMAIGEYSYSIGTATSPTNMLQGSAPFNPTHGATFVAWINARATSNFPQANSSLVGWNGTRTNLPTSFGSGATGVGFNLGTNPGVHMIAITFDPPVGSATTTTGRLYIDANLVLTNTSFPVFGSTLSWDPFQVVGTWAPFNMQAVSLHDIAMTQAQVLSLYTAGLVTKVTTSLSAGAHVAAYANPSPAFGAGARVLTYVGAKNLAAGAGIIAQARPAFGGGARIVITGTTQTIAAGANVRANRISFNIAAVIVKLATASLGAGSRISASSNALHFGGGAALSRTMTIPFSCGAVLSNAVSRASFGAGAVLIPAGPGPKAPTSFSGVGGDPLLFIRQRHRKQPIQGRTR